MSARPLIRQYEAVQAMSAMDTMDRVSELTRQLCGLNLEVDHARVILNRIGSAISESQTRNDDQTGWDVVGDLVDRAAVACDDIKTFDVPALAREAARDFRAEEKAEQRRYEA